MWCVYLCKVNGLGKSLLSVVLTIFWSDRHLGELDKNYVSSHQKNKYTHGERQDFTHKLKGILDSETQMKSLKVQ